MGTTGSSTEGAMNQELPNIVARVRQYAKVPLAVGFGVATRDHFNIVANAGADGVVIGSRIVTVIKEAPPNQVAEAVQKFCAEISQKGQPHRINTAPNGEVTTPVVNVNQDGPLIGNTS